MTAIPAVSSTALCGAGKNPNASGRHSPRAAHSLPRRCGRRVPHDAERDRQEACRHGGLGHPTRNGRRQPAAAQPLRIYERGGRPGQAHGDRGAHGRDENAHTSRPIAQGETCWRKATEADRSHAASAAPMKAIQSVKCCTITVDPGMPGSLHCRETISVMGSSVIAVRAAAGTRRSSGIQAPRRGGDRPVGGSARAIICGLPRRTRGNRRAVCGPRRTGRRESCRLATSGKPPPRLCATPLGRRRRRE